VAWDLDRARGWWLLIRDVVIILAAVGLLYHDAVIEAPPDPITVGVGLSLIAGVFGWRQDTHNKDGEK
jgi:hypothetical protein